MENIKCLIIGGGPAGYTAAIYAARANLAPVLYEGLQPGGQLTTTTDIENYPGFENGVSGPGLMVAMRTQAANLGADLRSGIMTRADLSSRPFRIGFDDGTEVSAESLIIATGATAKYLGLPSEEKFRGMGVSACATCDGFFYRGRTVAVVGGGDSACEEASYLATLCRKVYMIVRRDVLRASAAMQDKVKSTPNIEILWNCNVREVLGWVNVDKDGYIITEGKTSRTNVEGVFAAGDVQDPLYRQAITAAASGCRAAMDAEKFLNDIHYSSEK